MLCPLSYVPEGTAGLEPATVGFEKEPPSTQQADLSTEAPMAARPRFERRTPGSEPGVIPVSPPRIGLNGETRTPNPRFPKPVRYLLRHVQLVLTVGFEPTLTAV